MRVKSVMILGTGSHVGKTTLVAGLCRVFSDYGIKVTPFKSQNISLNSFATLQGEEIARSVAVQAFAARQERLMYKNLILLKPKSDPESQVIIHGKFLYDPYGIESDFLEIRGFGFFDFNIKFTKNKKVTQLIYRSISEGYFAHAGEISGYGIQWGEIEYGLEVVPLFASENGIEGAISQHPLIFGTFIHVIFKNGQFTRTLIKTSLEKRKIFCL